MSTQLASCSAQNGFTGPTELAGSAALGEPTLLLDRTRTSSDGDLYITAPQSIGNVNPSGGSPLYRSSDGGHSWQGPVRSQMCTGLSGGDTDLGVDGSGDLFQTDLWLGNACVSLSTDHGQSFAAGNPYGTSPSPGDDRPWIAYDKVSNQLFYTYDGEDAIHVTATAPLVTPQAGLQAVQDVPAVPECIVSGSNPCTNLQIRQCVCPPGGIAVDNSVGGAYSRTGSVYISYSHQNGIAVARSDPTLLSRAGLTWTPYFIPNTQQTTVTALDYNFQPIKVDNRGAVYVAWGQPSARGVAVEYASSTDGGSSWHGPFVVSTTTVTNVLPTLDVAGDGRLQIAYEGAPGATGDPNSTPADTSWNIYYVSVTAADTDSPNISSPVVAILGNHVGCISTGGLLGGACTDRSLLDFFTLQTDRDGLPNIAYVDGDATRGVNLFFTKLVALNSNVPEAPWAPALVVPTMAALALLSGRAQGRRTSRSMARTHRG